MNDEAAESRGPSGPSQDGPAPSAPAAENPAAASTPPAASSPAPTEPIPTGHVPTEPTPTEHIPTEPIHAGASPTEPIPTRPPAAYTPPTDGVPQADEPLTPRPGPDQTGQGQSDQDQTFPGTPGADLPPPPPGPQPPPSAPGLSFSRDQLIRPRQGRYLAGVCVALGRATNTDPVLWRVLLAVLGILSGVGVLIYLIGWLTIPAEGDTASPIESLLGKGRSGMQPLSIIVLGAGAVLAFAFIVNDGMRAGLLAAAVLLGAFLLIKRGGANTHGRPGGFPFTAPAAPGPVPADPPFGATHAPAGFATQAGFAPSSGFAPSTGFGTSTGFAASTATAADAAPATEPPTAPLPPQAPQFTAPTGGYRPPFAPHGPYAGAAHPPYQPDPQAQAPRPPKPPRERSKLGRLTFFAVVMVTGVMAVIDMAGASIAVSAYFAAALITIGLGLVVGAWLGRARGLIALAMITAVGLFVATGTERWGGDVGNSVYRPATIGAVADRYDFTAGNATLDLREIDFTGAQQNITVTMKLGQLRVLLPERVDTTTSLRVNNGRGTLFSKVFDGQADIDNVTDLGADGVGGGQLVLDLQMDTGKVEVTR
ncbi:PspC domain-containing protein [Micromonosporaceae bacterium Da 78-11]